MLKTERPEARFTSDLETRVEDGYRPLSTFVIIGFLISLISLTAVFSPLLWFLPVLAAIMSISAIWKLTRAETVQGGKSLATVGLLIALGVIFYAPTREFSREQAMFDQARVFTEAWLELVREHRIQEAHQLSLPYDERFTGGDLTLAEYYDNKIGPMMEKRLKSSHRSEETEMIEYGMQTGLMESPLNKLNEFKEGKAISKILTLPGQIELQFIENVAQHQVGKELSIIQRFAAKYADGQDVGSFEFSLRCERKPTWGTRDMHWHVQEFDETADQDSERPSEYGPEGV